MTPNEWAAVVGGVTAGTAAVYSVMRVSVKSILSELQPNSGKSLKDQMTRIESRVDRLYELMIENP